MTSDIITVLDKLRKVTGIELSSIPLDDTKTLDILCSGNIQGVPELEKETIRNIIVETQPTTFDELVKIVGLVKVQDVWENNVQDLIKEEKAKLKDVIACRDDIMNYLISLEIDDKTAFDIMEFVRKGKASKERWILKWEEYKKIMKNYNVPEWYINSCEKIKYMFPKAHAVSCLINYFRLTWFKVYYPNEFQTISNIVFKEDNNL